MNDDDNIRMEVEARVQEINERRKLQKEVEARKKEEAARLAGAAPDPKENGVTSNFVRGCLNANEYGDGVLYDFVNRDRFIFEPASGCWFFWNGTVFDRDVEGRSVAAVENVVEVYADYFYDLIKKEQKK